MHSGDEEDGRKARASRRRAKRRDAILAAARKVFSIKGYHQSSIADILTEAQVARGTFYLYFPSKRAIFDVLLEQMFTSITGAVRRIQVGPGTEPALEQMLGNVNRIIEVLVSNRELTIILLREAVGLDADFDQKLRAFYQRLGEMIQGGLRLGQSMGLVRPGDVRLLAYCVLGSLKEVMLQLLESAPKVELAREDLAREILEYNLYGVFLPLRTPE